MRKPLQISSKLLNRIRVGHQIMLMLKIVSLKLSKHHLLFHRRNKQKLSNKIRALLVLGHLILNCLLLSMSQKLKFYTPSIPTLLNLNHKSLLSHNLDLNPSLSLNLNLKTNHPRLSLDHSLKFKLIILNQNHINLLLNLLKDPKFLKKFNHSHNHKTKTTMI